MEYEFFNFNKNELLIYFYLYLKGEGDYELRVSDFMKMGMPKASFYNGRNALVKKGYLIEIATNYYHFKKSIV